MNNLLIRIILGGQKSITLLLKKQTDTFKSLVPENQGYYTIAQLNIWHGY